MSNLSDFLPYLKPGSSLHRSARTSNAQLVAADKGKLIDITSGTFTQTFAAAAALGDGWWCYVRNSGAGDITIPSSDGRTNWIMYPGEARLFQCDGAALMSIVVKGFYKEFTQSGVFIKPPGYGSFGYMLWGAGGSGSIGQSGGGGGGCAAGVVPESLLQNSEIVTIGAGGPSVSSGLGIPGGGSSVGALITAGGGSGGTSLLGNSLGIAWGASIIGVTAPSTSAASASSLYGGGIGLFDSAATGKTIYGGGGGGKAVRGTPSVYGGEGGFNGSDGQAPGGGGGAIASGTSGAGARGELRIWGVI